MSSPQLVPLSRGPVVLSSGSSATYSNLGLGACLDVGSWNLELSLASFHNQRNLRQRRMGAHTLPQVHDNLLFETSAPRTPAAGARKLFDAAPQSAKAQHPRGETQMA